MVIRNQETGLTLPPAPEFGPDGAWPPVETDWVPIRWQLFSAIPSDHFDACADIAHEIATRFGIGEEGDGPMYTENALNDDFLYRSLFADIEVVTGNVSKQWTWLSVKSAKIGDTDFFRTAHIELRRMVHSVRWRRNNPVTKLPPSTVHEMTHDITTGLSIEHSQTLANSFGLSLGGNAGSAPAQLSSRLQQEFGLRLGITSQERRSTKLTLSNPSNDRYRLFALWHVDHRITVDNLWVGRYTKDLQGPKAGIFDNVRPSWEQQADIEYVADSDPHITYAEVNSA